MSLKARRCFVAISPSRWVSRVFLTCDNMLAVEFRHGQHVQKISPHGPGAYLGRGGVPHVCCLYPGTQGELAETLYELAQTWSYAGEWVHHFLYKKYGYRLIAPPGECGGCNTICSLDISPDNPSAGQAVTITCKVTNTDGNPSKGAAPQGAVTISVDGESIGTVALPDEEPDARNWQQASVTWIASCHPQATHLVSVSYLPSEPDFAGTICRTTVVVSGCGGGGVVTPCCPNPIPQVLYATLSLVSGSCPEALGTFPLSYCGDYNGSPFWCSQPWMPCSGGGQRALCLQCEFGGNWGLSGFPPGTNCGGPYATLFDGQTLTLLSCSPLRLTGGPFTVQELRTDCDCLVNVTITP